MSRSPELINKKKIQVVVLVLENNQGDILLTQRKKHQHLAHHWEFPGGKIESGETNLGALTRECLEELNYRPIRPIKILEVPYDYPEVHVHLHVYHEQNNRAKVHPAEQQNMQWAPKNQLKLIKFPPANQFIINHLVSDNFRSNSC